MSKPLITKTLLLLVLTAGFGAQAEEKTRLVVAGSSRGGRTSVCAGNPKAYLTSTIRLVEAAIEETASFQLVSEKRIGMAVAKTENPDAVARDPNHLTEIYQRLGAERLLAVDIICMRSHIELNFSLYSIDSGDSRWARGNTLENRAETLEVVQRTIRELDGYKKTGRKAKRAYPLTLLPMEPVPGVIDRQQIGALHQAIKTALYQAGHEVMPLAEVRPLVKKGCDTLRCHLKLAMDMGTETALHVAIEKVAAACVVSYTFYDVNKGAIAKAGSVKSGCAPRALEKTLTDVATGLKGLP